MTAVFSNGDTQVSNLDANLRLTESPAMSSQESYSVIPSEAEGPHPEWLPTQPNKLAHYWQNRTP